MYPHMTQFEAKRQEHERELQLLAELRAASVRRAPRRRRRLVPALVTLLGLPGRA